MHVLGHSFSQKRKASKRPRDLHIRKVSFSGSSLSSGCSFSSSSSTSTFTPRTMTGGRADSGIALDPLQLHPTFQAPPRLFERPLIRPDETPRWPEAVSFFEEDSDDEEDLVEEDEEYGSNGTTPGDYSVKEPSGIAARHQMPEMELPPHAPSPLDGHTSLDSHQPQDYFMMQLSKRPPMPRSRWSESTIATIATIDTISRGSVVLGGDEDGEDVPNFSYKRNTVPKRPQMQTAGSVDEFIKRGGWKRRGIVFHNEDMNEDADEPFAG